MQGASAAGEEGCVGMFDGRPIVTVDLTIFAVIDELLQVLLVRRGAEPHLGAWALPGGFIRLEDDVDLDTAAHRVLLGKTAVATPYLEQVRSVGNLVRDPRGWTVSVTYMALISADDVSLRSGGNAEEAAWHPLEGDSVAKPLAFDHADLLAHAAARLRAKVEYSSLPAHLLPERFTLPELQAMYESILGRRLDKSVFRKRMVEADFVEAVQGERRLASNRPAQLYRLRPGEPLSLFNRVI